MVVARACRRDQARLTCRTPLLREVVQALQIVARIDLRIVTIWAGMNSEAVIL